MSYLHWHKLAGACWVMHMLFKLDVARIGAMAKEWITKTKWGRGTLTMTVLRIQGSEYGRARQPPHVRACGRRANPPANSAIATRRHASSHSGPAPRQSATPNAHRPQKLFDFESELANKLCCRCSLCTPDEQRPLRLSARKDACVCLS